ncbi:TPR Domain containing protein [Thecamonas trahens ATCC 50062]|uniref:Signal recognition particle subunit SRP72 n=1 Tax=Thecamonas trahens ATCC 50062 TaxID=461836 RepID=A0A0L0D1T1_THETB|nr:TPR Domain containing protein [Thecamonas trahens ATCC 50062]KNC46319.1 TPR Domain containing protein [Thecamonas trahens ATCC 50062]|eukprot:XP_013760612.1 TPR Domain containing protein [Thecamonas trahens ATCC 50062]
MSGTAAKYQKLQHHIENHAYKAALSVCKQLFEADPCKETRWAYISLLLLERQADKAADLFTPELSKELAFEHAYCLYRQSAFEEARELLSSLEASEGEAIPFKELRAQVLYKLEEYDEALMLYRSLLLDPNYGAVPIELKANYAASTVGSSMDLQLSKKEAREGFELLYNEATRAIAAGDLAGAEAGLHEAISVATEVLAGDGFTEDEIEEEVAVIRAQLGYVYQLSGRSEEAASVYAQLVEASLNDDTVLAVANNNITCLRQTADLFDSMKKSSKASAEVLRRRLTKAQQQAIALNRALLFMYMGKFEQCRALIDEMRKGEPTLVTPLFILATLYARENKMSKVEATLAAARDVDETASLLVAAQNAYNNKKWDEVLEMLAAEGLDEIRYTPAFVGTHAALLEAVGDAAGALEVIETAVEANGDCPELLEGAAEFLLGRGKAAQATVLLSKLLDLAPNSQLLRAKLVKALAFADPDKAELAATALPQPTPAAGNADALIASVLGAPKRTSGARKGKQSEAGAATSGDAADSSAAAGAASASTARPAKLVRKRKKKKNPPAKNFDPSRAPNPHRWTPMRDRPNFRNSRSRGRRNRGGRNINTSTQGAAASDDTYNGGNGGGKLKNNKKRNKKNKKKRR